MDCAGADNETVRRVQMATLLEGGHTRTGIEDHPYARPGELATSNEQMVGQ